MVFRKCSLSDSSVTYWGNVQAAITIGPVLPNLPASPTEGLCPSLDFEQSGGVAFFCPLEEPAEGAGTTCPITNRCMNLKSIREKRVCQENP